MNLFKQKFLRVPHLSILASLRESTKNPFVDWILILIISGVIVLLLIINSINLHKKVVNGEIQSSENTNLNSPKIFDQNELKSIISKFDSKALNF